MFVFCLCSVLLSTLDFKMVWYPCKLSFLFFFNSVTVVICNLTFAVEIYLTIYSL